MIKTAVLQIISIVNGIKQLLIIFKKSLKGSLLIKYTKKCVEIKIMGQISTLADFAQFLCNFVTKIACRARLQMVLKSLKIDISCSFF